MEEKYPGLREVLRQGKTSNITLTDPPRRVRLLSHQLLHGSMRDYVIDKIKKPMIKALIVLANRYPEPTRDNTLNQNSHLLFDIRDKFLEYEDGGRRELFNAIFKLLIVEYEHDPYYRSRINWVIEELVEATMDGKWLPRGENRPISCWREPKPFGMYKGRRFKKLIVRQDSLRVKGGNNG